MPPWQEDAIMHALFRGASVIPVLTIERERDAVPLARALFEGGLPVIEVALRTSVAAAAIAAISRELPHVVVGAGTLLRAADVGRAVQAGARFLVSPGMTPALGGVAFLKALAPVFPGVAFCPTGGIDERNAGEYLSLPNVPVVGGSWMAPREAILAGDWARIRRLAERAAALM